METEAEQLRRLGLFPDADAEILVRQPHLPHGYDAAVVEQGI